jgi:hypothetical protein
MATQPNWNNTAVKQYNTIVDTALTPLATGLIGDTSGAAGKVPIQEQMKNALPNQFDDQESKNAKMQALYSQAAGLAQSFKTARSATNSANKPLYDTAPLNSILAPHLEYLKSGNPFATTNPGNQAPGNQATPQASVPGSNLPSDMAATIYGSMNAGNKAPSLTAPSPQASPSPAAPAPAQVPPPPQSSSYPAAQPPQASSSASGPSNEDFMTAIASMFGGKAS